MHVEPRPKNKVNQVRKKFNTGHELRITTQISDYDMDYIILDLGSDVNILTRQTWKVWASHTWTGPLSSCNL